MVTGRLLMGRSSLVAALALFLIMFSEPPAQSRDATPCVGAGCLQAKPPTSPPRKDQPPVRVSLTVKDKTGTGLTGHRIQFGKMDLSASVTGSPANSPPPLYKFELYLGTNLNPITSGDFSSNSRWSWTPDWPVLSMSLDARFVVTVRLELPGGRILRTAEIGPIQVVDDDGARQVFSSRIGPVITFHRCASCHNAGDSPTQGDDRHVHVPAVNRQTDCRQCHLLVNGAQPGSPPGAEGHWRMAPPESSFAGKSAERICRQIKDPAQNGGRTLQELEDHVLRDNIIKWTWAPGPGRTPSPDSWQIFAMGAFRQWIALGAVCPEEAKPLPRLSDHACCSTVPDATAKGRLGRLVVAFPAGALPNGTKVAVLKDGKEVNAGYGNRTWDLLPGTYDVLISGKQVSNVTVQARHDTRVNVGVLRISAGKQTRVAVMDGDNEIAGGYGDRLFGLPPGLYDVTVAGQTQPVTISEGQVTEF